MFLSVCADRIGPGRRGGRSPLVKRLLKEEIRELGTLVKKARCRAEYDTDETSARDSQERETPGIIWRENKKKIQWTLIQIS